MTTPTTTTATAKMPTRAIRGLLNALIRGYQLLVSPVLPGSCRFYPTCSHYARDAITYHGVLQGGYMALRRIVRCHPWSESDFDPVPGSPLALHACSADHDGGTEDTSPQKLATRAG